jgi:anionic cell wall polymer biosynthesis LytR-Cps2A-Psr (LCP) family protein
MSASFEAMIADNEEYENFRKDVKIISSVDKKVEDKIPASSMALTKEPFVVFFGGNDEEGDLYLEGKTDVCMIVTVNPNTHQVAIVSLPRDSKGVIDYDAVKEKLEMVLEDDMNDDAPGDQELPE